MGTILESTNELAKRFGVEGEMTIKDTLDAIVKKLDDTYTDSKDIAEAVAEFSKNDGPDARLDTKSITANGTYAASSDDLDGYSSVTVDVPSGASFPFVAMTNFNQLDDNNKPKGSTTVFGPVNADGDFSVSLSDGRYDPQNPTQYYANEAMLFAPARKIVIAHAQNPTYNIIFSPSESFDGFYKNENKLTLTGDTITPGDGKVYKLNVNEMTSTNTITKYDAPVIPTT